jgi:hypothetical protein
VNAYGIIGTSHGPGNDSITAFLPASRITQNVMAGGNAGAYPGGNSFPTTAQFDAQFVSYAGGDYRLIGASPWHAAGTDGLDLGAVFSAAPAVTAAAPPPPAPPAAAAANPSPEPAGHAPERPWLDQQQQ